MQNNYCIQIHANLISCVLDRTLFFFSSCLRKVFPVPLRESSCIDHDSFGCKEQEPIRYLLRTTKLIRQSESGIAEPGAQTTSEILPSPPPTLLSFSFSCVGSISLSGYDWWPLRLWLVLSPAFLGFHSAFHPTR